jgi:hypothetical protein
MRAREFFDLNSKGCALAFHLSNGGGQENNGVRGADLKHVFNWAKWAKWGQEWMDLKGIAFWSLKVLTL